MRLITKGDFIRILISSVFVSRVPIDWLCKRGIFKEMQEKTRLLVVIPLKFILGLPNSSIFHSLNLIFTSFFFCSTSVLLLYLKFLSTCFFVRPVDRMMNNREELEEEEENCLLFCSTV